MARVVVGRDGRKSRSVSLINISLTSTSCSGDDGVSTTASSIPSIKKNDESHENQQKNASFPSGDMGSFTPTMSSFMIDDLPIPVHDFMSFEQKSIGATSVTPSQEELNHEAVGRRGNKLSPEERSIVSAEDKEFQLLINFLSENDENIYKYLLG
ncbi:predicted protein [Chaetoceros tenuissimus]|uniref:Uncharacterized protein n=1 Tax=Chaetoceros tenuissimus TaxID=426638 RepID=A0AAD3CLH7_9STRA|nr:predicted protein [Chaetoceros tenuissimus]